MKTPSIKSALLSWSLAALNVANACSIDGPGFVKNFLFFLGGVLFIVALDETIRILVDRGWL